MNRDEVYISILKEELIPAIGCTEPACLGYGAAKAREILGKIPMHIHVECSGNILKNVKACVVPNSGNLRGAKAAAVLGAVGGDWNSGLEVFSKLTDAHRQKAKELLETEFCSLSLLKTEKILHAIITATSQYHQVSVEIADSHDNIVSIARDGVFIFKEETESLIDNIPYNNKKELLNICDIFEFCHETALEPVKDIIMRQVNYNTAISKEGLNGEYGVSVGSNLIKHYGSGIITKARAAAAAGSDARMSGCLLPVIINSGSGNQGLAVSLPVIEYAEQMEASQDEMMRALMFSNLVAIHQKRFLGSLSAYCGAVCAACGAGAAITFLHKGSYEQICDTITNTLANVAGIVCDGAKPSCAVKIASAIDAAIMAHCLSMESERFTPGEGLVTDTIEKTIENFGRLGREGMKETDREILKMMIEE